ncbi:MAG: VWA domain-containing protein [Acidobacteriia bacterium]|nr:VWA domain-containing protein [Terriglobia bacterium]
MRLQRPAASLALLATLFLPAAPYSSAQQPSPQSPASIRVEVNRVNVGVIVTDAQGKFVEGLRQQDFHVFDDGVEQPLTNFAAMDEPAQIVLLLETGPAVYLLEGSHVRAASSLLDGLAPGDRIAIVAYADRPSPLLDFTADLPSAAAALSSLRFNLGFGQLNLASSLIALYDSLASLPGKKTIVLLSTGVDTSPQPAWDALPARLLTGDVRILAVSLGGELRAPPPTGKSGKRSKQDKKNPSPNAVSPEKAAAAEQGFAEADARLSAITAATGGRVFFPKGPREYPAVYAQIAQLVRHEYSLSFAPPARDGHVHSLEVRVSSAPTPPGTPSAPPAPATHPVYRVDHRRAYLAPR